MNETGRKGTLWYALRKGTLTLMGDTFQLRSDIKERGGRWNPSEKCWQLKWDPQWIPWLNALEAKALPQSEPLPTGALPAESEATTNEETLGVSTFLQRVRAQVQVLFPQGVWVEGEIVELRQTPNGHLWIEIAEKSAQEEVGETRLQGTDSLSAVCWASQKSHLESKWGPFELSVGLHLRLKLQAELSRQGRITAKILDIDLRSTEGDILLQRRKTLQILHRSGEAFLNGQKALSAFPLRIAVLGAIGTRGLTDFLDEMQRSSLAFSIQIIPSAVQGEALERDMLLGLEHISRHLEAHATVITRGGGARLDLRWFDSLELARAIARHPHPVLTAIGHTEDVSVADEVAHTRLKTPTAAAQFLKDRILGSWNTLTSQLERAVRHTGKSLDGRKGNLERWEATLAHRTQVRLLRESERLRHFENTLTPPRAVQRRLEWGRNEVTRLEKNLEKYVEHRLNRETQSLLLIEKHLNYLKSKRDNPYQKGFVSLETLSGIPLVPHRDLPKISPGERLLLRWWDGARLCTHEILWLPQSQDLPEDLSDS